MSRPKPLESAEIADRLKGLSGWAVTNGKLHREFTFVDFVDAFRFMTGAAFEAERLQHHPEWSNVYNRVMVDLVTHDAQGSPRSTSTSPGACSSSRAPHEGAHRRPRRRYRRPRPVGDDAVSRRGRRRVRALCRARRARRAVESNRVRGPRPAFTSPRPT